MPKKKLQLGICQSRLGIDPLAAIREGAAKFRDVYYEGSFTPTVDVKNMRPHWIVIDAKALLKRLVDDGYTDLGRRIQFERVESGEIFGKGYPQGDGVKSLPAYLDPLVDLFLEVELPDGASLDRNPQSDIYVQKLDRYSFTPDYSQCAFSGRALWRFTKLQSKVIQLLVEHRLHNSGNDGVSLETIKSELDTPQKIIAIFKRSGDIHRAYETVIQKKERGFYYFNTDYVPTEDDFRGNYRSE
jgi:hypothetical protein